MLGNIMTAWFATWTCSCVPASLETRYPVLSVCDDAYIPDATISACGYWGLGPFLHSVGLHITLPRPAYKRVFATKTFMHLSCDFPEIVARAMEPSYVVEAKGAGDSQCELANISIAML